MTACMIQLALGTVVLLTQTGIDSSQDDDRAGPGWRPAAEVFRQSWNDFTQATRWQRLPFSDDQLAPWEPLDLHYLIYEGPVMAAPQLPEPEVDLPANLSLGTGIPLITVWQRVLAGGKLEPVGWSEELAEPPYAP